MHPGGVNIFGKGFGSSAAQVGVSFNGTPATVQTLSGNRITTSVPAGATTGPITVTVPLSMLPSSGKAFDQWNVNFFARNPAQGRSVRGVASLTPEYTMFQVFVNPPPKQ